MPFNESMMSVGENPGQLPKLVRDCIPEIIEKRTGTKPDVTQPETDKEHRFYLYKKLHEETSEVSGAETQEERMKEVADLYEVLQAIIAFEGWTQEEIAAVQQKKRETNGGFDERFILNSYDSEEK